MKNLKNFAFGLLVAVLAVGFSAFTNAKRTKAPLWVYVQVDENQYEKIPAGTYDPINCDDDSDRECSFTQPENDTQDHGQTLNYSEVSSKGMTPSSLDGNYNL